MDTLVKAALEWAKRGIPVFPCGNNKAPLTTSGHLDASTDPEKVKAMFEFSQAALIGARMGEGSGLFAIDFDLYKAGAEQYMQYLSDKGLLADTQVHTTRSGGIHLVYRGDTQFPNCKPHIGVEVKGEGGYIIVPPSPGYAVHKTGIAYASPQLIAELLKGKKQQSSSTVDELKQRVLSGSDFHDSLTQIAARRSAQGWSIDRVQKEILDTLKASAASVEGHPRHDRWKAVIGDSSGELSRIVGSGNDKFNPQQATDKLRDAVAENSAPYEALQETSRLLFSDPPRLGDGVSGAAPAALPEPIQEGVWPFEQDGYFSQADRDILSQRYVMYPLLAERETMLLAAEPKAGKTAIALKLAMCVARGENLGEGLVVADPRPVLYFSLEGARAVEMRLAADKLWRREKELPDIGTDRLFVVDRPHNFLQDKEQVNNAARIVAHDKMCRDEFNQSLGLIVIDTLTKAMPGGDQNAVEDTSKLFKLVDLLRQAGVTATIMFLHHLSKQGNVRGSTNIEAEVDIVTGLRKPKDQTGVVLNIRRARSLDEDISYHFKFVSYFIGETVQGHKLHAPLIELVGAERNDDSAQEARKATAWETLNKHLVTELGTGTHSIAALAMALSEYVPPAKGRAPNFRAQAVQKPLRALFGERVTWAFGSYHMTLKKEGEVIVGLDIR